MSRLEKRLKKLEGSGSPGIIVYLPEDFPYEERYSFARDFIRSEGLPPDTRYICYTPEDVRA